MHEEEKKQQQHQIESRRVQIKLPLREQLREYTTTRKRIVDYFAMNPYHMLALGRGDPCSTAYHWLYLNTVCTYCTCKYLYYVRTGTKKTVMPAQTRNLKNEPQWCSYNLDGALFLKKRLVCACLHCFSLLIVLLESMMQCAILLFCCFFIIAHCQILKKQACSAGCLLADVTMTQRETYVQFFENEWSADRQADFSFFMYSLSIILLCVLMSTYCLMMTDSVWQPKHTLVIVLSILCGWVPLYWHSTCWCMSLMYVPPQPLTACMGVWHCNGWLICGKCRTCSCGPVWLLLSSSDSLWCDERAAAEDPRLEQLSKRGGRYVEARV